MENPVINERPKIMLTVQQVSDKLGLAVSTIWQKNREGKMPQGKKYPHTKGEYNLKNMDLIGKSSFDDIKKCLSKFCLEIDMRHLFNN